jgi:hypothetical protein
MMGGGLRALSFRSGLFSCLQPCSQHVIPSTPFRWASRSCFRLVWGPYSPLGPQLWWSSVTCNTWSSRRSNHSRRMGSRSTCPDQLRRGQQCEGAFDLFLRTLAPAHLQHQQWLFDSPTAPPRLLKFRSGHQLPPHLIRYYGDDGKQLLTASRDRSLRCTSVVRDSRSFELSQGLCASSICHPVWTNLSLSLGHMGKKASTLSIPLASLKLPPITALSYSTTRMKDWDDILTTHANETVARTWTMLGKKIGKYALDFVGTVKRTQTCPTAQVNMLLSPSGMISHLCGVRPCASLRAVTSAS